MVNDLRSLLHETSDNAPLDHFDVASTIRQGNSRLRRRRATIAGASALVAGAVIGSTLVLGGDSPDRNPPDGPTTQPVGEVLDLQDATASDLEPILRYESEAGTSPGLRYVDGVTEDGRAIVRTTSDLPRAAMTLVDLETGAEYALPDLPGLRHWLLEATDDRIVYNNDMLDMQSSDRSQEVRALVLEGASEAWRAMRWPDLPEGTVLSRDVGPDGRLYVAINPDISLDTMQTDGATGDLWSVSLTDAADVRDEGLTVGLFAIDGDNLVWSERAGGVSNLLTVRDLETGEETSFDPQSGRHCTQASLGVDSDRIVMSQTCGTEDGVTDDRVQVVSMTGEPVVTIQDDQILGQVDQGGHVLIEATGAGDEGVYSYDLVSGDFVRLSTSTALYVPPAQVADGYLLWAESHKGQTGFAQTIAEAP